MRRMALGDVEALLAKASVPWVKRPQGPNVSSWQGRDLQGFVKDTKDIEKFIRGGAHNPQFVRDWLVSNRNYNPSGEGWEARMTIDEVLDGKMRTNEITGESMLRQRAMGIPNTEADEALSMALLESSGLGSIRAGNGNPVYATDILGTIDADDVGIDAQMRTRRNGALTLGMLKGVPSVQRAAEQLNNATSNTTLRQALNHLQSKRGVKEDKFLHTIGRHNRNPSRNLENNIENYRKDYLISSDRRGYRPSQSDMQGIDRHHGPYNPELPSDWKMIDLNRMRGDLLDQPVRDLVADGQYRFRGYGSGAGSLNMIVPHKEIIRLSDADLLDDEVLRMMTK